MTSSNFGSIPYSPLPNVLDVLRDRGHIPAKERSSFKDAYGFLCPFHADTRPSFWVTGDGMQWHCWTGCGGGGVTKLLQLFGQEPAYRPPKAPKSPRKSQAGVEERLQGCTLAQVARAKAMPPEHLRALGWYDTEHRYKLNGEWATCRAVAIPYANSVQLRVGLDQGQRFKWEYGHPENARELYGIEWLLPIDGVVLVVEGATDVAAARYMGIPAVGIPGTSTWKSNGKKWAERLAGHELVVWQEPGEAAEKMVEAIAGDIPDLRVIKAPDGVKDVCELLDQAGSGAGEWLRELIAEAEPFFEPAPGRSTDHAQERGNVASTDISKNLYIRNRDRDQIRWDRANELWPPDYRVPHAGKYAARMSKSTFAVAFVKGYAHTWHHPENEKQKKRLIYSNVIPRMLIDPQIFWHEYHHEDFNNLKYLALKKQVERAGGDHNMLCVDNVQGRGSYLCFASVQLEGWEQCSDVEAEFVKAIDRIRVPEDGSRFQPVKGTQGWVRKMTAPRIKDAGQWDDIGYADGKDLDLVYVEAEARAEGIPYDETPVYKEWRKTGIGKMLVVYPPSLEEGLRFAASCGIKLKPRYRAILEEVGVT
jgi:hypothetical protein